jgi:hypothetical protein
VLCDVSNAVPHPRAAPILPSLGAPLERRWKAGQHVFVRGYGELSHRTIIVFRDSMVAAGREMKKIRERTQGGGEHLSSSARSKDNVR